MKRLLLFLILFPCSEIYAQENKNPDKESVLSKTEKVINPILKRDSTFHSDELRLTADKFLPHEGKIIRNIFTTQLGFEIDIEDNDYEIINTGTDILNNIHIKSTTATIKRNIYFEEGDSLKSYLLADNERFLRTIRYIQDARINIIPISGTKDSVDVLVVTKDIFGYSGVLDGLSPQRQKVGISSINLLGSGKTVGINILNDQERKPAFGLEGFFGWQNIEGTFIDAEVLVSNIDGNLYNKKEDELSFLLDLELPLVSQYKRWAGGFKIGRMDSKNRFPDIYGTGIYQYKMGILDTWIGYNIGAKKYLKDQNQKLKKFVSLRYYTENFFQTPEQIGEEKYDSRFNSKHGILMGLTLFKQNYYKTNYLYAFGTTEDIPAGYNGTLILGLYRQLDISRPYLGLNLYNYTLSSSGDMTGLFFRYGSFYRENKIEDIGIVLGASMFMRLVEVKNTPVRNYFRLSYALIRNMYISDPLRINNSFGLYGFGSDLAKGNQRISFRTESYIFLKRKILGFNIAPIAIADIAWLNHYATPFNAAGFFFALGGGVRIKNENLGLSTIEIRASLLPRKLLGDNYISFHFLTNLNFHYRGNYVTKPELIELNGDSNNHIF